MKKDKKIRRELLDELLAGYAKPEDLTGPEGLLKQLAGALVERALEAELTDHLGYDAHAVEGRSSGNSRNGSGSTTLQTEQGPVPIEVPRDRNGTFEPQLVKNHQRRFTGFDDKILGMYARGMSVRDIQAQLSELYGTGAEDPLHDQCDRIAQLPTPKDHQVEGTFPERRSSDQAALPRPTQRGKEVAASSEDMEECSQPIRNSLRGPTPVVTA